MAFSETKQSQSLPNWYKQPKEESHLSSLYKVAEFRMLARNSQRWLRTLSLRLTTTTRHRAVSQYDWRSFASDSKETKDGENLQDTIKRMKESSKDASSTGPDMDGFIRQATQGWTSFSSEVGKTWDELLRSGERKDINKKLIHPEDTAEGETPYTGSVEIMVIDESENLTAWDRMKKRLTEAPIITGKILVCWQ